MNKIREMLITTKINKNTIEYYKSKGKLYFFGSGDACRNFMEVTGIKPKYIFDNNKEKIGKNAWGIEIIHPQCIRNIQGEFYIIITSMFYKEIAQQLEIIGLKEVENYIYYDDLLKKLYLEKNKNAKHIPSLLEKDIEEIRDKFIKNDIEVQNISLDENEFKMFIKKYDFGKEYIEGYGKSATEKLIEHYFSYKLLGLNCYSEDDIYVDVAANESPWALLLYNDNKKVYAIDLEESQRFFQYDFYKKMDATKTIFKDNSVKGMSLQCAFEMFINDDDINFIVEASRILKSGGKVIINPLYMHKLYCFTSSLDMYGKGYADNNAVEYIRTDYWGIKGSRKYDVENFIDRIIRTCDKHSMEYKIYYLENDKFIEEKGVYLKFIFELTKK